MSTFNSTASTALLAALLCFTPAAPAGTITEGVNLGASDRAGNYQSYNQFNPALGELYSVELIVNAVINDSTYIIQNTTPSPITTTADLFSTLTTDGRSGFPVHSLLMFTVPARGATSYVPMASVNYDVTLTTGLAQYIGLGTIQPVAFLFTSLGNAAPGIAISQPFLDGESQGTEQVVYTYGLADPPPAAVSIPEPRSIVLLSLGLALVGLFACRA